MLTTYEIQQILEGKSNEAADAHLGIINLQKNKDDILKLGHPYLDNMLIGGANNKMIFIGSRPGMGKTHHCASTINNLLDPSINPNQGIELLRMNLEMTTQALMLRELKLALKRDMSDIISRPYSEDEREIVSKVVKKFKDKRVTNLSYPVQGQELEYTLKRFSELVDIKEEKVGHKIKRVILVDHLHIYPDKKTIDDVLRTCNSFKMKDKNMTFIFYFQFNREAEDMWRESKDKKTNPRYMLPHSGHIYLTDLLMQFADIVLGLVIPQAVDLDEFVAVHKEKNAHLKEHFIPSTNTSDKTFVRLKGRNRIYYNYIKVRMVDSFDTPKLYCDVLNPSLEEKYDREVYSSTAESSEAPPPPIFEAPINNFNSPALRKAAKESELIDFVTKQQKELESIDEEEDMDAPF